MQNIYPSIALKLFGYGIKSLHDPNWTEMILYYHVKQHVRGRVEPVNLLRKPLERGLSYCLGEWFFDEYFSKLRLEDLHGEYAAWFLEDFYEMLKYHQFESSQSLQDLKYLVDRIDKMYDDKEEEYWDYLDSEEGNGEIEQIFENAFSSYEKSLQLLRSKYAEDFADRMLHDRQLCFYTSQLLLQIGFDGDDDDTGPKQWVEREYWPERVKAILKARDRGKCTSCGSDLILELEAPVHIDHMIPIVKGGCNDIVNLQILCDSCNLNKSANLQEIKSSVPKYLKRKST